MAPSNHSSSLGIPLMQHSTPRLIHILHTPCLKWQHCHIGPHFTSNRATEPHLGTHSTSNPVKPFLIAPYSTTTFRIFTARHHIAHVPHHRSTSHHHISHLTLHDITCSITLYRTYSTSITPYSTANLGCTRHNIPHLALQNILHHTKFHITLCVIWWY